MSDVTNMHDDERALAQRLRATFDAEAATLESRQDGRAQPAVAATAARDTAPTVSSPNGWRRAVLPIAAAIVVMLGLVGIATLAKTGGSADLVADDHTGQPAAASSAAQADASAEDEAPIAAAIDPDDSGAEAEATAALPRPTVAPAQTDPNLVAGSADHVPSVSAIQELCVTGIVAPDTLNVRAGPSTQAAILAELQPGQCGIMQLSASVDGWTPVGIDGPSSSQIRGLVSSRYVTSAGGPGLPGGAPEYCVTDIVAPDTLTLRSGPSVDAAAVARLKPDRCGIIRLAPPTSGWLPIQVTGPLGSVYVGYVSERFVVPAQGGIWMPSFQPNMIDRPWCATPPQDGAAVALRIAPSDDAFVIANLAPNECQVFPTNDTDPTGQWTRVAVASLDRGGWVRTQTLRPTEEFLEFDPGTPIASVRFDLFLRFDRGVTVNPSHFRMLTTDGKTIGTLAQDGVIGLPVDIDPETVTLLGYINDKYCVTTGTPTATADGTYTVLLWPELCV